MISITTQNINDYLHFGYVPEFGDPSIINHILNPPIGLDSLEGYSEEDLIQQGIKVLNNVFDELVKTNDVTKNIIPLSGGLDSRLILAALVERMDPNKIEALTFGSPGTFDYDLPDKVVKKTQVKSRKINCISLDYSLNKLVEATNNGGEWTSVPDNYINRLSLEDNKDVGHWSGFMGGEIGGEYSTLGSENGDNSSIFSNYQRRSKSLKLTSENYNPMRSLKKTSVVPYNLTEFEMLFLTNRSAGGAIPIMYPKNKAVISPFLHPLWVNFIIRVPKKYREHADIFQKIILRMYPELMSLGCKNNNGLGLGNKNKTQHFFNLINLKIRYEVKQFMNSVNYPPIGINYLHYKSAIKTIPSLNNALIESCNCLEDRGVIPWLSPNKILQQHLSGEVDNSEPLLILLGLEVNLRAEESYKIVKNRIDHGS